jgi:zinc protease
MLYGDLPPASAALGQTGPEVASYVLDNGLHLVVLPDRRAPVVTHMVWYRNGAADDPAGRSGIAHFLEHLMFKGTARYPAGVFSKQLAALGGQENAFTSYDYTAYFQRVAREHLADVMTYEADRMTGLAFDESVVAPERDVVLEERRMRVDSDPGAQLGEELSAALYLHHPYGLPVIGWEHEIAALSHDDAFTYYRRFYTPDNAILVVAGDIEPSEALALASRIYGAVAPTGMRAQRQRVAEPPARALRSVTVADPRVRQPALYRMLVAPAYRPEHGRVPYALDVALDILGGGGATARIYRDLVVDRKLAAHAGASYWGSMLDSGRVSFSASPMDGVSLEGLDEALSACVERFLSEGPTEQELARSRLRLVADTIYARDSQSGLARAYGAALAVGETLADIAAWPSRIDAVTRDEVIEAARATINLGVGARGFLKPAA